MAARPNPHRALSICVRAANRSLRRVDATIEATRSLLESNARLTPAERVAYTEILQVARGVRTAIAAVAHFEIPRAPRVPAHRKVGRPSKEEIAKNDRARDDVNRLRRKRS